ncbi:glycosyl transferase family 2 [Cricetibacter osteomyelitidis]|uniref:Glycosyl transferase family 2 n=1 Tax=Cricetibacter osteomyelitidis TaxID=1521931 RepID=A0A4V2T290_9PAST|nr:glycosyltransferase [Cricetibacter osteomyelitidis]TCP96473.1 glycosyl transferase family 2 [Cricetibacter osteomyelitidis]
MSNNKDVTVVITSAGRFDLLEETLDSFFAYNTYPIHKIIITEDSNEGNKLTKLVAKYKDQNFQLIINNQRLGQLRSIDKAYKEVDTTYIFHCEDDWHFFAKGFIEKSLDLLEEDKNILIVGLRPKSDYGTDFFTEQDYISQQQEHFYQAKNEVFTFNPGLRRKSDMALFGLYEPLANQPFEKVLSDFYQEKGFAMVFLKEPAVMHIGDKRRVHFSKKNKNTMLKLKLDQLMKRIKVKLLNLFK